MKRTGPMAPAMGAIALTAVAVPVALAGLGLLVAAAVTALVPHVGLPGALALVALALFLLVGLLALAIRAALRAAQARARSTATMRSLAQLALILLPKGQVGRLMGGVQIGLGLALIALPLLRRKG